MTNTLQNTFCIQNTSFKLIYKDAMSLSGQRRNNTLQNTFYKTPTAQNNISLLTKETERD